MALLDAVLVLCRARLGWPGRTGRQQMAIELGQLAMLCRDIDEQRRRFGGKCVSLLWWPNADQPVFSRGGFIFPGDPCERTSGFAQEIRASRLLHPPHDAWGHNHRVPGSVFFDPNDDQPDAILVFRELAGRVGQFLQSQRPDLCEVELKPLIESTHPEVRPRDWTLAWIFRRQFDDCDDEPNFGGELTDAFGLLVECIDEELATVSRKSPSPKIPPRNSTGKRTLWADFWTSGSARVETPNVPSIAPIKYELRPDEEEFFIEVHNEIVRVCGFDEDVKLEKTEGVQRLIAIVTAPTRRVGVMELARIGAAQQVSDRDSIHLDADGLTERESVNDEQFEAVLGDGASQAVRDEVGELIARKKAADERSDVTKSKELKEQIDAILNPLRTELAKSAKAVQNSLDRTYERLRKDKKGQLLAAHFSKAVTRPRTSSEYVYDPDESESKIVWTVK